MAEALSCDGEPSGNADDLVEIKNQEIERLKVEIAEKDEMLTDLQRTLKDNSSSVEELLKEAHSVVDHTSETYAAQLAEKDKQLTIMQALLDDARKQSSSSTASSLLQSGNADARKPDRAFMDDYLISVLEQKDNLQDELHTLNNAYADVKAKLGMAEFEKEKMQAEYRAASRARQAGSASTTSASSSPGNSADAVEKGFIIVEGSSARASPEGETIEQIRDERDRLAASLAEMNRTVQQLRERTGAGDHVTSTGSTSNASSAAALKESERRRRKDAHRSGLPLRDRARLAELEKENKELRGQLKHKAATGSVDDDNGTGAGDERVSELQEQLSHKTRMLQDRDSALQRAEEELGMLRSLLGTSASGRTDKMDLEDKLAEAEKKHAQLSEAHSAIVAQLAASQTQCETLTAQAAAAQAELSDEKSKSTAVCGNQEVAIAELTAAIDAANKRVLALQAAADNAVAGESRCQAVQRAAEAERDAVHDLFLAEQDKRRVLHNMLVELTGNIRVFCRLRPASGSLAVPTSTPGGSSETVVVRSAGSMAVEALAQEVWRAFEYDRVFGPDDDTQRVFTDVLPLVRSFVDGYNVCVMAYGQTGSGKTHTMLGKPEDGGTRFSDGIIPSAMQEVFLLRDAQRTAASIEVEITVLEVYNDYVRDLLSDAPWAKHEVTEGGGCADVPTAKRVPANNSDAVLVLVAKGMAARVERRTDLNAHSSRSHLIVTIHATRVSLLHDGTITKSRMHLVDLAGSENAKMAAHSDADGVTEGKAINKSLSALSTVMLSLSKQASGLPKSHVPYRNSRLTHLLKDAIGGNAKTLMIVCIHPELAFLTESMQSLRFGSKARCIQKGSAQKNVVMPNPSSDIKTAAGRKKKKTLPSAKDTLPLEDTAA